MARKKRNIEAAQSAFDYAKRLMPRKSTKSALPATTEDEVQKVIVDGLRAYGYLVLITTRRVKKCWSCGKWAKSGTGDGVSKGLGDLLVTRSNWPPGLWFNLEVKRPGPIAWSSPEQQLLAEEGDIVVVQSLEDALAALEGMP